MRGLKNQPGLLFSTYGLLLFFTHCLSLESESAFSIGSLDSDHGFITTEERAVEVFEKWRERHGKSDNTGQHEVGLNVFADMSNEEFGQTYLPSSSKLISKRIKENNPPMHTTDCEAPISMDWRKKGVVTPVKNQRQCEKKRVTIDGYKDVAPDENALFCSVANQPISVGIVGSSLDFQLYTGGIYDGDCTNDPKDIDHGVLIVGYGSKEDQDYWIVKNSWGTKWEYGVCAINAMASYPTKTLVSPFPSPISPPPSPPSPCPNKCGEHVAYCPSGETCCCILKFYGVCFIYGCCGYENGVCCSESIFCCPQDFPVCDIEYGVCLQNNGDYVGVAAKRSKMAKHKFPWTKCEGNYEEPQAQRPLDLIWKTRNQFSATL
ncbi:hypothetical protein MKW94_023974 [Papaver nudicaule]|uniref:Uncharacterized protein n=1 Tax=Papaver nudicaule TaxID=74823 RepID=A0AA42AZS1_PAPNU|nr:hypothetical protein [Papaver nudicaule]